MKTNSLTAGDLSYIRALYSKRIADYKTLGVMDISVAIFNVFKDNDGPPEPLSRKELVPLLMRTMHVGRNKVERSGGILNQMIAAGVLKKEMHEVTRYRPDPSIKQSVQPEPMIRDLTTLADVDAIEVARIGGVSPVNGDEENSLIRFGKELINTYLKSSRCNVRGEDWILIAQYLFQQGYALPLFISPSHPDNGKTVLDLGIEFEKPWTPKRTLRRR